MRMWGRIIFLVLLSGLLLIVGRWCAWPMNTVTGTRAPLILVASSGTVSLGILLLGLLVGVSVNVITARRTGPLPALLIFGFFLLGYASRTGTMQEVILQDIGLSSLLIESLLWSFILSLTLFCLMRAARRTGAARRSGPGDFDRTSLLGLIALLPVAWLFARSELKGQAIAAATIASLVAVFIGHLCARRIPAILIVAIPLVGGLGYIIAALAGWPSVQETTGGLAALLIPMPQDYAAGATFGGAIGAAWAQSLLHEVTSAPVGNDQSANGPLLGSREQSS